jgi:hypothetical protein
MIFDVRMYLIDYTIPKIFYNYCRESHCCTFWQVHGFGWHHESRFSLIFSCFLVTLSLTILAFKSFNLISEVPHGKTHQNVHA